MGGGVVSKEAFANNNVCAITLNFFFSEWSPCSVLGFKVVKITKTIIYLFNYFSVWKYYIKLISYS